MTSTAGGNTTALQLLHVNPLFDSRQRATPVLCCTCCRGAEARRWRHAVERQAGEIGELRVEVDGERRRQRELEAALSAAAGEVAAAQQHVAELMGQLAAAEAAVAAAEGALGCRAAAHLPVGWGGGTA